MTSLTAILVTAMTLAASPAFACSASELQAKQKAFGEAAKAAFQRDPGGHAARQAKLEEVTARYLATLKGSTNGSYIIDMLCKENDELLAIYK